MSNEIAKERHNKQKLITNQMFHQLKIRAVTPFSLKINNCTV